MNTNTLNQQVITLAREVVVALGQHGHNLAATDLNNLINNLLSGNAQVQHEVLQNIRERCDVRWLGDLYMQGMTLKEWWGILEQLKTAAGRALKAI